MPLTPVTYWEVTCDKCGSDVGGDYSAWKQEDAAINEAQDSDWSVWLPPPPLLGVPGRPRMHCYACPPLCEECGAETDKDAGDRDYKCRTCWDKSETEATT